MLVSFLHFNVIPQDTIKVRRSSSETVSIMDTSPEFPGGVNAMYNFIGKNCKFPERCKTDSAFSRCTVYTKFVVDETGKVQNAVVIKGCLNFPECEKEALRLINLMPLWKPAILNNLPVSTYYQMPINFKRQ